MSSMRKSCGSKCARKRFLFCLLPLLCGACAQPARPVWLPLGATYRTCNPQYATQTPKGNDIVAEVYQENDRLTVQTNVLQVMQEPRWFTGFGSQPPDTIQAISLTNQGATLSLQIQPTDSPDILLFVLTLNAGNRTLWREVEHRRTNILPFLFTFAADGKSIGPKPFAWGEICGANSMTELVSPGKSASWNLKVDSKSLLAAIGKYPFHTLTVVAAFSEYQHDYPAFCGDPSQEWRGDKPQGYFKGPPIVLRSNVVALHFDGQTWKAE